MSIVRKAIRGTIWVTIVQICVMLSSFGANTILARILLPESFGTFALALSIVEFFFILSAWSFSLAVIQIKECSDELINTGFSLSLLVGIGISTLILISSFILVKFYSKQIIYLSCILSAIYAINILGYYYASLLERDLEYFRLSIIRLPSQFISWLCAILLAWLGAGVWSLLGQQMLIMVISFIGYRIITGRRLRWRLHRDAMLRLFNFGKRMFVSRGLEIVFYRLGNWTVGTLLGTLQLGYFNQAITLSEMGHRFSWPALGQIPFAAYSRLQDEKDKLSRGYELVNYCLIRFLAPLCLVFLLLGKQIIVFLYGENWRPAGLLLQILSVYTLVTPIFENMKALVYSQDRIYAAVVTRVIQLTFLIPGMYLVSKRWGTLGVVYVLDITVLVGICVICLWIRKVVSVNIRELILSPLIASLGTIVLWKICFERMKAWEPHLWDMCIGTGSILSFYFILILILERRKLWFRINILLKSFK